MNVEIWNSSNELEKGFLYTILFYHTGISPIALIEELPMKKKCNNFIIIEKNK